MRKYLAFEYIDNQNKLSSKNIIDKNGNEIINGLEYELFNDLIEL